MSSSLKGLGVRFVEGHSMVAFAVPVSVAFGGTKVRSATRWWRHASKFELRYVAASRSRYAPAREPWIV